MEQIPENYTKTSSNGIFSEETVKSVKNSQNQ